MKSSLEAIINQIYAHSLKYATHPLKYNFEVVARVNESISVTLRDFEHINIDDTNKKVTLITAVMKNSAQPDIING